MFGIGLMELITILVLATVVLGPERMVEFAGQMGRWLAKFRAETDSVTKEFREAFNLELLDLTPGSTQTTPRWSLPTAASLLAPPAEPPATAEPVNAQPAAEPVVISEPERVPVEVLVNTSPDAEPVSIGVGELVPEDDQVEPTELGGPVWVDGPVVLDQPVAISLKDDEYQEKDNGAGSEGIA
jgi:Sec-independent protein translocase protein TatA